MTGEATPLSHRGQGDLKDPRQVVGGGEGQVHRRDCIVDHDNVAIDCITAQLNTSYK